MGWMAAEQDDVNERPSSNEAAAPTPPGSGSHALSPAAERALAEAAARRAQRERAAANAPTELKGRGGLDPVRYGDWEVKGIASDF